MIWKALGILRDVTIFSIGGLTLGPFIYMTGNPKIIMNYQIRASMYLQSLIDRAKELK